MCRLIFINKKYNIKILNKFFDQSIKPKNTPGLNNKRDQDLHLDGFGFIWSDNNKIFHYKNEKRPQLDYNLKTISEIIPKNFLIGHLRATKSCQQTPINYHTTHPFYYNDFYFFHNGCIEKFKINKNILLTAINHKYINLIKSSCDSEYLFYLFLSIFDTIDINIMEDKLINTIKKFFEFLNFLSGTVSANIIINYKNFNIITRFINNDEIPPSLYTNENYDFISSEPIDNNNILVQKNTCIFIKDKNYKILNLI